jgi:hypothetical protein
MPPIIEDGGAGGYSESLGKIGDQFYRLAQYGGGRL